MTHTPGGKAMLHTQWPVHVRDEGGGGIHLVADNGRYIAHFFEPKRRNVYNALRIAALWNMAERLRLTTEEIESGNVETKLKAAPDMLRALEEVVAITENLPVCPFCGAVKEVQKHSPDCLSHEIDQTIRKARGNGNG